MLISHEHPRYRTNEKIKHNGAFYYSREIVNNIIPNVRTNRNWITINVPGFGYDDSIVFIHNNKNPKLYEWMRGHKNLICVCGIPETCEKMEWLGKTIYLPLSVDVEEVEKYKTNKTKKRAYVGRIGKRKDVSFPAGTDFIEGLPREELLKRMAEYEEIYAVGRTAIEGKILGCKILPYDERFPNPDRWQILDNKDAAKILQEKIDDIDGRDNGMRNCGKEIKKDESI